MRKVKILKLMTSMVVLAVCVLMFFIRSADWWVHLDLSENIEKITVDSGGIIGIIPDRKPAAVLKYPSETLEELLELLERSYHYRRIVKRPSLAKIEVIYSDGTRDYVYVGDRIIQHYSGMKDETFTYKIRKTDWELVRSLLEDLMR